MAVLVAGVFFGLVGVKPIPIIILAQALNGVVLPFVAVFLVLVVNDHALMGDRINGGVANTVTSVVVAVTVVLGVSKTATAVATVLGLSAPGQEMLLITSTVVTLILAIPVAHRIRRTRQAHPGSRGD